MNNGTPILRLSVCLCRIHHRALAHTKTTCDTPPCFTFARIRNKAITSEMLALKVNTLATLTLVDSHQTAIPPCIHLYARVKCTGLVYVHFLFSSRSNVCNTQVRRAQCGGLRVRQ